MKKILLMCLSLLLFASALVSCEDWTEPESKVFLKGDGHDDAYYAALRGRLEQKLLMGVRRRDKHDV